MATMGSFVKHKTERTVGIVISWDHVNPGYLVVRIWSESKKDYINRSVHPNHVMGLETWGNFEQLHNNVPGFKEAYNEIAMELALRTNDKQWFEELFVHAGQKKEGEGV